MLKSFFHRQIAAYERRYGYDAAYMHEVLDASLSAFFKFGLFQIMSMHRDSVSKDAWFAARMAATLSEDCGPCTQLVVNMALEAKVRTTDITALLRGDIEQVGADAALGFRYGMAVAANAPDTVILSEEVEKRFGKRGLVSLAFAVTSARVYPCLKRGLGHGDVCTKIAVSNEMIVIKRVA